MIQIQERQGFTPLNVFLAFSHPAGIKLNPLIPDSEKTLANQNHSRKG